MQHDVYVNPGPATRGAFPFIVDVQSNLAEGRDRLVAPLVAAHNLPKATGRVSPLVRHDGKEYRLALMLMTAVPRRRLTDAVGSVAGHRDEITRAIDWLFTRV